MNLEIIKKVVQNIGKYVILHYSQNLRNLPRDYEKIQVKNLNEIQKQYKLTKRTKNDQWCI